VLSNELEYCLNDTFHQAREARHEFLTVEHLLLAIVDTPKVREILRACSTDIAKLQQELKDYLEHSTPRLKEGEQREVQPTLGFQRVLQRAVFHVQSSGKKEVGVANVLVAIFSEKESHAVDLFNRQHVTRVDVVNYISHGLSKSEAGTASTDRSATESAYAPEVTRSVHTGPATVAAWNPSGREGPPNAAGRRLELARLLGPVLIVMAVAGSVNREDPAATAGPALAAELYWSGLLIFLAGLAIVRAHNVWSRRWHALITLVGWLAIGVGLVRMIAPAWAQQLGRSVPASWGALAALFVVGIVLTYKAYGRAASRSG
jgi:hypothetical protein